jgi:hypothetical protein
MAAHAVGDRSRFREVLAAKIACAKLKLPESNGRVEMAGSLVLMGDVSGPDDAGAWQVGSCSDPAKVYHVQGTTCDCHDWERAPQHRCKHLLAVMIVIRVREVLEAEAAQGPTSDDDHRTLPEAPASVNVRLHVAGREVQLTLRDHDEVALLERLEKVLQRYPDAPKSAKFADVGGHRSAPPDSPQCTVHHVPMKRVTKGGRSWYSHWDEATGGWCNGK